MSSVEIERGVVSGADGMFHVVSDLYHEKRDPDGAKSPRVRVGLINARGSWLHLRT